MRRWMYALLLAGGALACLPPEAQKLTLRAAFRSLPMEDQVVFAPILEGMENTAVAACDPGSAHYADRSIHIRHPQDDTGSAPQAVDAAMFEAARAIVAGDTQTAEARAGLAIHIAADLAWPLQASASLWEDENGEGNTEGAGHRATDAAADKLARGLTAKSLLVSSFGDPIEPDAQAWAKEASADYEAMRGKDGEKIKAAFRRAVSQEVRALRWIAASARFLAAQAQAQAEQESMRQAYEAQGSTRPAK